MTPVTFSFDLEDHRANRGSAGRHADMTVRVLDFLDTVHVRGTFFVLGEVAAEHPDLVRRISDTGHEIAFHSFDHRPLTEETPDRFRELTLKGKALLEDLTGSQVIGFRAPTFSLVRSSLWVVDLLQEMEFLYSSSVLPASNPLYGFPGAPQTPFKWPNGLIELPVPVARLGRLSVPYLGGIYLRYLPKGVIRMLRRVDAKELGDNQVPWTYSHPYDFDGGERFGRVRDASLITSVLLWMNRDDRFRKLGEVLQPEAGPCFREMVQAGRFAGCPTFDAFQDA